MRHVAEVVARMRDGGVGEGVVEEEAWTEIIMR